MSYMTDVQWKDRKITNLSMNSNLQDSIPKGEIIERYCRTMYEIVSRVCPRLEPFEIVEGIQYSIQKKYKEIPVKVHNNFKDRTAEMSLLDLTNQLLQDSAILTTQGVLFAKYGTMHNPFYNFVQYLLDKRDEAKAIMKTFKKGTEGYKKYDLMQKNYKVACNALYGCCGNWSSVFYNLYLCTAVTGQGRGCISASITMFESFLANNVKLGSLTEVLQFIENVSSDTYSAFKCKYHDWEVLDKNVTIEECFLKVMRQCGYKSWVPTDEERDIIWMTVCNLDQRTINSLYYVNNLYEFCNNSRVHSLILKILVDLEEPFMNPNKPPENVQEDLDTLYAMMFQYVYYRHLYIDKLERVYTMKRDITLLTDTDSCVVCLDEWYRYVLKYTVGIPMKIKYTREQIHAAADKIILEYQKTEATSEVDFYNQELVDKKRLTYPAVIIEEDNLRFSIINIISYIVSQLILDYMDLFSDNYNASAPGRKRMLIMKNEFLFKSMLITPGKKNYATLQLLQEGNIIPDDKQIDIKGMPITKVGMPKSTSDQLQDLLEFDVLRRSFIDQVDLIRKFATLEKKIYKSIAEKNKEYHKPARIRSMHSYDTPMRVPGVRGAFAYNAIKSPEEEGVKLDERSTVLIIKTKITNKNVDMIMDTFPEHYIRMKKLLENENFKGKIQAIAIPTNIAIPDWIIPFIDYTSIIHDNLRNFPLEQLGISKIDSKDITHTNLIHF